MESYYYYYLMLHYFTVVVVFHYWVVSKHEKGNYSVGNEEKVQEKLGMICVVSSFLLVCYPMVDILSAQSTLLLKCVQDDLTVLQIW